MQESGRAVSERWIDERAALLHGGTARTHTARCWMHSISHQQQGLLLLNPAFLVAAVIVEAVQPADPPSWYAEVAFYPRGAADGSLPLAIAPFPVEVGVAVQQRGEVAVRGEPAAGRGLVVVLPDGTSVGCAGPASPAPAFRRKRVRLRAEG
ncbi:MAG TPA: hypothetical protein VGO60_09710 [Iamia sp.]|nr:hypothetical protein [Iamia sp.]